MIKQRSNKLLFLTILLFLTSIGVFIFILNIKNFIYPDFIPLNPNKPGVTSFGISQKLYAVVDNIEESEQDGQVIRVVSLVPLPDEDRTYEDKKIQIEYNELNWENLPQILLYWNTSTSNWDEYSEKPANIKEGIEITDTVVIYNDNFYYKVSTPNVSKPDSFARIIGVIKRS